jgi:RNase H-fold protein (predicted Holliday junction resolvase)
MDEELRGMRAACGGATALGVDYGMNRTGFAVSAGGVAPRPLNVVDSKPIDVLVKETVRMAIKERADVIVVGLPVPPNMTAAQAAGLERAPRMKRKKSLGSESPTPESRLARVDVATLMAKRFRCIEDLEDWLGADGLARELAKHGMKAGGTKRERAERLEKLIDAGGVLNDVPSRFFPGNANGKRLAVRRALGVVDVPDLPLSETSDGENDDDDDDDDDFQKPQKPSSSGPVGPRRGGFVRGDLARGGTSERAFLVKNENRPRRPPREMHVLCRRFAERVADAAAALDVPIPVELYDESRTSLQAGLAVEASRGRAGRPNAGVKSNAHLDDVAAALLLERYFKKDHGPAIPVKPMGGSDANAPPS